ncbi:MAG TPA: ATP-binding protein [Myxococcota bacterium]|nr:ATP-binding protein [Myxococcota bacterium]
MFVTAPPRSEPRRVLLSWSSGKDSAWCLQLLRQSADIKVVGLVTTVNETYGRVAMHAVREVLLERQAAAAGLPIWRVPIPSPCSNAQYEEAMGRVVARAVAEGISGMAFGDLFLEEIRRYREARLAGTGLEPIFPLWGLPTDALARTMVGAGLRARITCVDPAQLPAHFAGREFDEALLTSLPPGVDPCGERGEFHTFAYAGPMFRGRVGVQSGEIVERDGFVFADLTPTAEGHAS